MGRIVTLCSGSALGSTAVEDGVAALVVRGGPLLLGGEHEALAPGAHHDAVAGVLEVDALDLLAAAAHGEQRRLVDQVGEVGAAHARRALGHDLEVDVGAHPLVAAVHLQDGQALVVLGQRHDDLAVEAAGAQQRRIEDVGPVGGGQDDDALADVSKPSISASIWLSVCSRSSWPPPRPAPRLRPIESISSTKMIARPILRACWNRSRTRLAPTPTNISMKSRAGDREEADAGLAGDGPGEQRLAGAGRADEQDALRHAGADLAGSARACAGSRRPR